LDDVPPNLPKNWANVSSRNPACWYAGFVKITLDVDPDLYRTLKVEAARADRSVRAVVAEAIEQWIERLEDAEDVASASDALEEYRRDGGTAAAAFFENLAAETRAEYGSDD
jgi:predicted DNA-binding protein